MTNWTLSEIGIDIALLVGIISGAACLINGLKQWMSTLFDNKLEPINSKLTVLEKRVGRVDAQQTKNYLVRCMNDIENGTINESELERFWEQYKYYTDKDKLDQNGYIKSKVEKLQKEGKL